MPVKYQTVLKVNDVPIDLNEFAHEYISRIVLCAVGMLKGGSDVKDLLYNMEGNQTGLIINHVAIPLSAFPRDALVCTFTGMASSLRGVHQIDKLEIEMKAV